MPTIVKSLLSLVLVIAFVTPSAATGKTGGDLRISEVSPAAGTNTLYEDQPLSARVSGFTGMLTAKNAVFTLRDVTSARTWRHYGRQWIGDRVATDPVRLSLGHVYSIAVSVHDSLGRVASYDQAANQLTGFRAIATEMTAVRVHVQGDSPRVVRSHGVRVSRVHLLVDVSPSAIRLSGTQHAGFGFMFIPLDLHALKACLTSIAKRCDRDSIADDMTPGLAVEFASPRSSDAPLILRTQTVSRYDLGTIDLPVCHGSANRCNFARDFTVMGVLPTCSLQTYPSGCNADPIRFVLPAVAAKALNQRGDRVLEALFAHDPSVTAATMQQLKVSTNWLYYLGVVEARKMVPVFTSPIPVRFGPSATTLSKSYLDICTAASWACSSNTAAPTANDVCKHDPNKGGTYECHRTITIGEFMANVVETTDYPDKTHQYMASGGGATTCDATNCNDWENIHFGIYDDDYCSGSGCLSGHDRLHGNALTWPASWAINYEAAHGGMHTYQSSCYNTAEWYFSPVQDITHYTPGWKGNLRIDQRSGTNAIGMQYGHGLFVGHAQCSYVPSGSLEGATLSEWGVAADLIEGHYHNENGVIGGEFIYSWKRTDWHWSFSCGFGNCAIGTSPQTETYGYPLAADPKNIKY